MNLENKSIFLIKKLSQKENKLESMFEIFNILFLIKNILTKEKFINIINNIDDLELRNMIILKCLKLNDINYFNLTYKKTQEDFNTKLSYFLKKIDFLKIDDLNKFNLNIKEI